MCVCVCIALPFNVIRTKSWQAYIMISRCWLIKFHVLATSRVIFRQVLTCDSAHSWQPLGNHVTSTMTEYPIESYYPDTELTSSYQILLMSSAKLVSDNH